MKYHRAPFYTAAAASKANYTLHQHTLVQAIYRHRTLALGTIIVPGRSYPDNLLATSAALIRQWNAAVSPEEKALLGRENQVPVVQVWTGVHEPAGSRRPQPRQIGWICSILRK